MTGQVHGLRSAETARVVADMEVLLTRTKLALDQNPKLNELISACPGLTGDEPLPDVRHEALRRVIKHCR